MLSGVERYQALKLELFRGNFVFSYFRYVSLDFECQSKVDCRTMALEVYEPALSNREKVHCMKVTFLLQIQGTCSGKIQVKIYL